MFMRDLLQKISIDVAGDDLRKRRVAGEPLTAEQPSYGLLLHQLIGRIGCVDLLQRRIIARSEKGEWRSQRTGADTRYNVELGSVAARGPANQKACPECPVRTTAGNRKKANLWSCALLE